MASRMTKRGKRKTVFDTGKKKRALDPRTAMAEQRKRGKLGFAFNGKNEAAQKAAAKAAAKMVTRATGEQRAAVRQLIVASIRDGVAPHDAARQIRSVVGLNARQAASVKAYRADLLLRSGLPVSRVTQLVERFAAKKLAERAEGIARYEIMNALHRGAEEVWRQAVADGFVSETARKRWMVTHDDKLCPECEAMDGETVPILDDFSQDGPPLHPGGCRCVPVPIP